MDKKNFPLNTRVKFVKTTGKLDNQTGQILGKAIVSIEDHIYSSTRYSDRRISCCCYHRTLFRGNLK